MGSCTTEKRGPLPRMRTPKRFSPGRPAPISVTADRSAAARGGQRRFDALPEDESYLAR